MLIVKNKTATQKVWCGQEIEADGQYQVQAGEQIKWSNDEVFLEALGAGHAVLNDGYEDVSIGKAINILKQTEIYNRDGESNPYFKQMIAVDGMFFRPRTIDFKTGVYKSLCNKNSEGADLGDCEILFFDSSRTPMVKAEGESDAEFQIRLDAGCKYTWLYFTPKTKYAARGAAIAKRGVCSGEFDAWFERAPHIPKIYGGSVAAIEGGLPLELLGDGQIVIMDAGSCAIVEVDPVYISHRMGLKIEHEIGDKVTVLAIFMIYA